MDQFFFQTCLESQSAPVRRRVHAREAYDTTRTVANAVRVQHARRNDVKHDHGGGGV